VLRETRRPFKERAAGVLDRLAAKDNPELDEGEAEVLEILSLLVETADLEEFLANP
jgi:hypothetical protein